MLADVVLGVIGAGVWPEQYLSWARSGKVRKAGKQTPLRPSRPFRPFRNGARGPAVI